MTFLKKITSALIVSFAFLSSPNLAQCYTEYCDPYSKYQDPYSKYQDPYSEYQDPYSEKYIPSCKKTGAC